MATIRVRLDVYRNAFNFDANGNGPECCYTNVRVINSQDQTALSISLDEMYLSEDPQLLDPNLICLNKYTPIEIDRECLFNLDTKTFLFDN